MELLNNLEKVKTTDLGRARISKNLKLNSTVDPLVYCLEKIEKAKKIIQNGKNWYVHDEECIITINANNFTVITAHKLDD